MPSNNTDFLGKEIVTHCAVFIVRPLLIAAFTERIPTILQQRITSAVEGYWQQHSSQLIENVGYFCIICTNCWCESPYLFTIMLLVIWPEEMVKFFLGKVMLKRQP